MDAHDQKSKPERSVMPPAELQQVNIVLAGFQPGAPVVKVEEQSIDNSHGSMEHTVPPMELESQTNDNTKSTISSSSGDLSTLSQAMGIDTKFDNLLSDLREDRAQRDEMIQSRLAMVESSIQSRLGMIESSIQAVKVQRSESSTSPTVKRLREQLAAEKEQLKTLKQQYGEVKKENNYVVKKYNALSRNYNKQTEELEKTKDMLHEVLEERDQEQTAMDGRSLANASKETDGTIMSLWTQIAYDIRQLAHLLANSPGTQELDDTVTRRLRLLTTDYRKFLSSQDHCIDLMQGYLWLVLKCKVFDATPPIWGGSRSTSLKRAKYDLYAQIISLDQDDSEYEVTMAEAARCFAQIFTMFNGFWDEDETLINHAINEEAKIMEPFLPQRHGKTDRADQKVCDQLKYIFRNAIKLDKIIMTSKAFFERRWQDPYQDREGSQFFNEKYMISDNHERALTPKSRVLFCLAPMLLKSGTADGQDYCCTIVLQKGRVVCN
ncbi:hypothetical protein FSHL1_003177 [Fusarium sambucinum]